MAYYSTGVSVSWGDYVFSEVTSVAPQVGGTRAGREAPWLGNAGTVTVQMFGGAMADSNFVGLIGTLVVTGGGIELTAPAIYESWSAATELNGVTRYTVSFTLVDY